MSETLQIPVCGSLMLSSYTLIIRSSHLVLDFVLWSFGFVSCSPCGIPPSAGPHSGIQQGKCLRFRISTTTQYMVQWQNGRGKASRKPYECESSLWLCKWRFLAAKTEVISLDSV